MRARIQAAMGFAWRVSVTMAAMKDSKIGDLDTRMAWLLIYGVHGDEESFCKIATLFPRWYLIRLIIYRYFKNLRERTTRCLTSLQFLFIWKVSHFYDISWNSTRDLIFILFDVSVWKLWLQNDARTCRSSNSILYSKSSSQAGITDVCGRCFRLQLSP